MKRLSFPSLIIFLLIILASCSTPSLPDEEAIAVLLSVKSTREETFASTQEAYEKFPSDSRVLYNYAYMLLDYKRYEECISVCDEGLALNPISLRFCYLKARAAFESGRHQTYLSCLESILAFDPGNVDVLELLAEYNENFFKHSTAAEYAIRLIDLDPSNTVAIRILAVDSPYFASLAKEIKDTNEIDLDERRSVSLPPFDLSAALELFVENH